MIKINSGIGNSFLSNSEESSDMIFLFVFSSILLFVFFVEKVTRRYLTKIGLPFEEFPSVNQKIISKFKTFDRRLGWSPKETSNHPDNTGNLIGFSTRNTFYSIDNNGSRIFQNRFEKSHISTFGDSFAMCRQVNDNETLQFFLSQKTKSFVANYGVGGYGLDQALLRLESLNLPIETKYVVCLVSPWTIERLLACWKHYIEPGNVLGAKPRFVLKGNKLELIENFIQSRENFKNLRNYKNFLHENDGNFPWFVQKQKTLHKMALWYIVSNKKLLDYLLSYTQIKTQKEKCFEKFFRKIEPFIVENLQEESVYLQSLYQKHSALLKAILMRFVKYCRSNAWTPIFVMLPSYFHIEFMQQGNPLYRKQINSICKEIELQYLDMFEVWNSFDRMELKRYFVDVYGHHSVVGNQVIAEVLFERFFAQEF